MELEIILMVVVNIMGVSDTWTWARSERVNQLSNLNLSPMERVQNLYPFLIALLLSGHGLRKKSLSPSGALTAFVVGFLMMSGGVRVFGLALIALYLAGSRATKCEYWWGVFLNMHSENALLIVDGNKRKAQIEDGHQEAGYRSGWQVLCNSASGLVAAFLWNAAFVPTSIHSRTANIIGVDISATILHLETRVVYDNNEWCPLSRTVANGWSRTLVLSVLGYVPVGVTSVEMLTYRKALCLLPWGYVGIRIGDLIEFAAEADYDPEIRTAWDERCDIGGWNSCVYCWRWSYWDCGGGHDGA